MKGLTGDFTTMPLKDLVVYLANRRASGSLTLEHGPVIKRAVLDQGNVVNASSNVPREFLGQFLINLGHITEEQFQRAYQTQQETKIFLGRILMMIGLISEENLQAVLQLKFRETLLDAFEWKEGTFHFEATPLALPEGVAAAVPLLELHRESDFRVQAWEHFRRAFPRLSCTLTLKRENLEGPPRPGSVDEKVLHFIEAGMTLEEIGLRLHATEFFLFNRLYALYRLGALIVHDEAEEFDIDVDEDLGERPGPARLLDRARAFQAQGSWGEAWALARKANQLAPGPEVALLLREIELAWLPELQAKLLASGKTPRVLVPADGRSSLPLTAPERYLLSRIDGKRTVEAIVRVAPIKEFDALAFLARFASQKWVALS